MVRGATAFPREKEARKPARRPLPPFFPRKPVSSLPKLLYLLRETWMDTQRDTNWEEGEETDFLVKSLRLHSSEPMHKYRAWLARSSITYNLGGFA